MEPIDIDTFEDEMRKLRLPRDRKAATREQLDRHAELSAAVTAYYGRLAAGGPGDGEEIPDWCRELMEETERYREGKA